MPAKAKRRIAAEDLYQFQTVTTPRISPDGQWVIYSVQRVDRKTKKKYNNLWVVPADGSSEPRQFTWGDQKDGLPAWSPDGQQIAFLSNRGALEKPPQIYLIPFFGGEARKLADIPGEVNSLAWSPDGKRLLCAVRKTDPEALEREKDETRKKLGVIDRHYDRLFYKLDGYGYLPHEREHIWTVDARTGKTRQLTDHPVYDEREVAWSPDGKWIAFVSNRSADPDQNIDCDDLFVMPSSGGQMRRIDAPVGTKVQPSFSPDGRWLAYYGQEGEGLGYKNLGLWVVPVDGSARPRNLTEAYDLHTAPWTINDLGTTESMPPIWSQDGQTLWFPTSEKGSALLRQIQVDGGQLGVVIARAGVVGSPTLDKAHRRLAYFFATQSDPGQVHVLDLPDGSDRTLTRHNLDWLAEVDLGQMEEVWFKGRDGNDLQGWILKPPQFDPNQQYPSILEIHGGPRTQYGNAFMHEFYYLASKGFVVYFSNPRGGRGYGEQHTQAIFGGWGDADYADLMSWADYLQGQPYIDPQRMGVTGGSYGGYMTVWIIGHTQRFKAAVTARCVSNFVSMWGSSDFNWTFEQELGNQPPFRDLEKYWKHSPIAYIGNATTPTLVIHNEFDLRCPIEQGEQVFVALKRLGVETEFVRFPDEFHGLSRTGRTDRRIARLNHILRWFETHLKD